MQRSLVGVGLALLMVAACEAQPGCSPSAKVKCTDGSAPHHAYVVVQHMSGASIQSCVGFTDSSIDGQTIMDRSGIEYQAQEVRSGKVVCQVDGEPAQVTDCFPQNRPYWALFVESNGRWASAAGGFAEVRLGDREAIGWHYVQAGDPSPPPPPMPHEA